MSRIKIIGENYPQVGETFYWKDEDNDIYESTCLKIEGEDMDIETMFFIYISNNGCGTFVTESDIVDSNSKEVIEFKIRRAKEKIKEISDYIGQEEIRSILYNKLRKYNQYDDDSANRILDILSYYE